MATLNATAGTIDAEVEAPAQSARKYRVQLDFTGEDFQDLNDLTVKLGLQTRAELFRSSMIALRWMYKKKVQGYTIAAVSPGRKFLAEPDFPFLERVTVDKTAAAAEAEIASAFQEVAFQEVAV